MKTSAKLFVPEGEYHGHWQLWYVTFVVDGHGMFQATTATKGPTETTPCMVHVDENLELTVEVK